MLDNEKLLFDEIYEKTKDCGRVQFVELLMTKERENKELKLQLKGTTHCFDEEEHEKLKKQVENYKELGFKYLQDKNNKLETRQKEFINYLEDKIDICDGFLDTVKSDLRNTPYRVISSKKTNITIRIKENEIAHKVYKEILQKYKETIGVSDEKEN